MDIQYRVILDPTDPHGRFTSGEWENGSGVWQSDRSGINNNPIPAKVGDVIHFTVRPADGHSILPQNTYLLVLLFARNKQGRNDDRQTSTPFSRNARPHAALISNPTVQNGQLVVSPQNISAKGFFEFSVLVRMNINGDANNSHDFTRDPEIEVTDVPIKAASY